MSKHRKSGVAHNSKHFTGKTRGKRQRCKGKRLTKKQRRMKRGKHKNKYKKS